MKNTFLFLIRKENEKYIFLFPGEPLYSYASKIALRDWKLSWSLPRAVTLLSEWSLYTFSCHWSRPRDIRCIEPSLSFFALKEKEQEEDTRKRSWAEKKKTERKRLKKGGKAFFRNKIDKIELDKSKNKFWEVHKMDFLFWSRLVFFFHQKIIFFSFIFYICGNIFMFSEIHFLLLFLTSFSKTPFFLV